MGKVISTLGTAIYAGARGLGPFNWGTFGLTLGLSLLSGMGRQESGRLTDLGVQTSEEGQPIPRGWGTWRQSGNLIWCPGLTEHKDRNSGKGQPSVTEFSYSTSGFIMGGLGPIDRLLKIWANNKFLYDYNDGDERGFDLTASEDGDYFYGDLNGATIRVYRGVQNQSIDPTMEAAKGVGNTPSYEYRWGVVVDKFFLTEYFGNSMPNFTFEVYNSKVALDEIILEIAGWVGLTEDDFDLSALSGINIDGFVLDSRQTAAAALSQLMERYFFYLVEVDGVLRAVKKGIASIETLSEADLRIHTPNTPTPNTTLLDRNARELPAIEEVVFYDPKRKYHPGHRQGRRYVVDSVKKETTTFNMAAQPDTMEQWARIKAHLGWTESEVYGLSMGLPALKYSAADVVTIPTPEGNKTVFLPKLRVPLFGPITCDAPVSDSVLFTAPLLTDDTDPLPTKPIEMPGDFFYIMADCNTLRLQDAANAGFYVGAGSPRNTTFGGVELACRTSGVMLGGDNKKFKEWGTTLNLAATIGDIDGTLPDHAGGSSDWDTTTTLRVQLVTGRDLASSTDSKVLNNGANAALVGSEANGWEIIQFVNATYVETLPDGVTKVWDLSRLKRGRRGSESQIATHTSGEKFLLLDDAVERVEVQPNAIGVEYTWRFNRYLAQNNPVDHAFTVSGNNLKPLAVKSITSEQDASGNWAFRWTNVSRLFDLPSGLGGSAIDPIAPDLDRYEIEVLDPADDSVVNSYATSAPVPVYVYKASEQIADFGELQDTVKIRIYRMSAVVGRGYPATIEVSA